MRRCCGACLTLPPPAWRGCVLARREATRPAPATSVPAHPSPSGPEKEAEIEEEIMEFEEEGGLAVSLVVWVLALVGPLALLVYLRLKTSLLGATPPASSGSAVLSALEGASKGAAAGPAGKEVKAAEVPSAAALSKAALLRQLEEENIRLRQQSAPSAK